MNDDQKGNVTFFANCATFPDVDLSLDSIAIDTVQFLDASAEIVKFVDLLGTVFTPVKSDISGNIDKLQAAYSANRDLFQNLSKLIRSEQQTLRADEFHVATDALIWLTRALAYVEKFLICLLDDYRSGRCQADLTDYFIAAYDNSLRQYHNWFVQKLFGVCLIAAPGRQQLLKLIAGGSRDQEVDDEAIFEAIEQFLQNMSSNIFAIHRLFDNLKIEY